MNTTGPTSTSAGTRHAALIDLENVLIVQGRLLRTSATSEVFHSLDAHLAGMQVRVASGLRVARACMPELASRGWGRTLVPSLPDAADTALIEAGQHLASRGVTDLVVVSGDHAFASLAEVARLHVIAHRHQLSAALRMAATTVTYLPDTRALDLASA